MNNFIGEYDISLPLCDDLVTFFNDAKAKGQTNIGLVGNGVFKKHVKSCEQLAIDNANNVYPFNEFMDELQYCLNEYVKEYPDVGNYYPFSAGENYNMQYYKPNDGYYEWHSEALIPEHSKRVLVWMTYLNDVNDGGTEFKYYNYKTKAIKGKTLIWPSGFTHTHRGQISETQEKYIITGWFSFNE